jgi:hypothetical protein
MVSLSLELSATNYKCPKYSICIKTNFVRWKAKKLPAAGNLKSGTILLEGGTEIWDTE